MVVAVTCLGQISKDPEEPLMTQRVERALHPSWHWGNIPLVGLHCQLHGRRRWINQLPRLRCITYGPPGNYRERRGAVHSLFQHRSPRLTD